ncbi:hypothetical protein GTW64_09375 [Streptomyces sp. SID4923]|nr:hypothetical protein [Streptomyces sp. SID4923]
MSWGRGGLWCVAVRVGCACGGPVPLPAPSRNRGPAPDPAPQAPEGLGCAPGPGFGAPPRAPLLKRRRGWILRRRSGSMRGSGPVPRPSPWPSSPRPSPPRSGAAGVPCWTGGG